MTRALARGRSAPPLVVAQALNTSWAVSLDQGDVQLFPRRGSAAVRPEGAGSMEKGFGLFSIAVLAFIWGEMGEAEALAEEGLIPPQENGGSWMEVRHLQVLGLVPWARGEYAAVYTFFQKALEISRELGDEWYTGMMLSQLGFVTRRAGNFEEARAYPRKGVLGPAAERSSGSRYSPVGASGSRSRRGDRSARLLTALGRRYGRKRAGIYLPYSWKNTTTSLTAHES